MDLIGSIDFAGMVVDRVLADTELLGDLFFEIALEKQIEDSQLSGGQFLGDWQRSAGSQVPWVNSFDFRVGFEIAIRG